MADYDPRTPWALKCAHHSGGLCMTCAARREEALAWLQLLGGPANFDSYKGIAHSLSDHGRLNALRGSDVWKMVPRVAELEERIAELRQQIDKRTEVQAETNAKLGDALAGREGERASFNTEREEWVKDKSLLESKIADLADCLAKTQNDLHFAEGQLAMVMTSRDDVWLWQGDGHDHVGTLSCPVVMSADTLRKMCVPDPDDEAQWTERLETVERDVRLACETELKALRAKVAALVPAVSMLLEMRDSAEYTYESAYQTFLKGGAHEVWEAARAALALAGGKTE